MSPKYFTSIYHLHKVLLEVALFLAMIYLILNINLRKPKYFGSKKLDCGGMTKNGISQMCLKNT